MNPSLENNINWEKMFFDPVRIRFSRYGEIYKDKPTLVSCINPRDQQYTHFYWNDGLGSIVDRDWGRYLIFQDTRKNVLVFDPEKQQLGVPAPCPLPLLLTRAVTLCSGKTPSQISYFYPHDGDQKDVIPLNIYDDVPAEIAVRIAEKVGQELIPDKFSI